MGFRGSRVQIPPSRLSEDQALQPLRLWGFFFVAPRAVSNGVSIYRLTIRCVGCNTTFLIVSASACSRRRLGNRASGGRIEGQRNQPCVEGEVTPLAPSGPGHQAPPRGRPLHFTVLR